MSQTGVCRRFFILWFVRGSGRCEVRRCAQLLAQGQDEQCGYTENHTEEPLGERVSATAKVAEPSADVRPEEAAQVADAVDEAHARAGCRRGNEFGNQRPERPIPGD